MRTGTKRFLCATLTASLMLPLAACGSKSGGSKTSNSGKEGKVLNICVWNDEFINRLSDNYPGYKKIDDTHGKIGDVKVNFIVKENQGNNYQNMLDKKLPENEKKSADDRVDMFLIEADYALKYTDADANVAMKLKDLGIKDSDLSDQFQYTKDIVTDKNGDIRGSSWQACSAGLIYNRKIAKEVIGSDDPETVQAAVSDWDKFNQLADTLKEHNYKVTATAQDTFRVYSNNVSAKWVDDSGKIKIDDSFKKWADASKKLVDAGETTTEELWGDDWKKGFQEDPGDVFCYFGPAWLINFSMGNAPDKADDGSIAHAGGWGLCQGPQSYYWGGSWICAATGTDNPTLVKDIILKMTTDKDILTHIAKEDSDCVNSKTVLNQLSTTDKGNNAVLGGQNPYKMLEEGAEKIDMSKTCPYDQGLNEAYQNAMTDYYNGDVDYDGAIEEFYKAALEKYPDLKK